MLIVKLICIISNMQIHLQFMDIVLLIGSILLIISVLITLIHNDYWLFKVLEYPRLQKLFLILLVLIGWFFYWPLSFHQQIVFGGLCAASIYLLYKISPYTILTSKEMLRAKEHNPENSLKIFAANVYQPNDQYGKLLQQINETDPDLVFLLETDEKWARGVHVLEQKYPYTLKKALDNTYGLLFFSRLPIESGKVVYLVKNDIPSIDAIISLPSGQKVQLWGLHPEPPVPGESLYATAKDKELMKVALKARSCKLPHIVFGDLNDVAWSHTTELFRKTSELLDPRRGRGFYSTFSARSWFIRFPLDYIFCSKEFFLVEMKRLPKNGSDHFSTFVHLLYKKNTEGQTEPHASKSELKDAKRIAQKPIKNES